MKTSTSIRIEIETKKELDKLKVHRRQSYDEVIILLIKFAEDINKKVH